MSNLNIGDIVEVKYPPGHIHESWNGIIFKIVGMGNYSSQGLPWVAGQVIREGKAYFKNDSICWTALEVLHQVSVDNLQQLAMEQQRQENYFSPFTGKWT